MKIRILFLTTICTLILPATCHSSFLVQLTNGNRFIVSEHWERGNLVGFYSHGGKIEIPKERIRKITRYQANTEADSDGLPQILLPKPVEILTTGSAEAQHGIKKAARIKPISLESYKNKQDLKAKLQQALETFRQASGNRDIEAKRRAIEDMTRTSAQLSRLE